MITSIEFQNFRGFSRLTLEDIKPITLISGQNNIGKSSVLDGVFLFFDHLSPDSFAKLNSFRGLPTSTEPKTLWEPVFHRLDTKEPVQISLGLSQGPATLQYERDESYVVPERGEIPPGVRQQFLSSTRPSYSLKLQYTCGDYWESGHFVANASGLFREMDTSLGKGMARTLPFAQFLNGAIIQTFQAASLLGELELKGQKGPLLETLRLVEPSISDLTTILTEAGGTQVYAKINGQLLPVRLAGDGLNKLLVLLLTLFCHPNSLLLIDEIETGLHWSAYRDLWQKIALAARENHCQILATTHSYECIAAAAEGLEAVNMAEDLCYFRLDRRGKGISAARYTDDLLHTALDVNLEVR